VLWCARLQDGVSAVRRYGGADLGYRTMLDAVLPLLQLGPALRLVAVALASALRCRVLVQLIPASRTLNDQLKQGSCCGPVFCEGSFACGLPLFVRVLVPQASRGCRRWSRR
jgi:hypothetical protein